jgi:hypothetical protein
MIFECVKCCEIFEAGNGIQVIVHGQTIGRVCPACIAGARSIQLILQPKKPGKPPTLTHVEIDKPADEFTE